MTVLLLTIAAFLLVLALLARQLRAAAPGPPRPVVVLRKIYETRYVETLAAQQDGAPGTTVTQSVSNSASSAAVAPRTRAS